MVLEFIGADREVTGSCHYLTFGDTHILIDCGMEQGADLYVKKNIEIKCIDNFSPHFHRQE